MFWKNVTSVLTGTAIAQAIPILASIAIARLYSVEAFGLYSAWLAVVIILSVVLTGRYELVIAVLAPGKERALALRATTIFVFITGTILASLYYILSLFEFFGDSFLSTEIIALLIPTGMAMAISQIIQSILAANGDYKKLSLFRILQALLIVIPQITIGYWNNSAMYLALSHLVGVITALLFFFPFIVEFKQSGITKKKLIYFFRRHYKFPTFSLPGGLMNSLSAQLPVILVTSNFGAELGGVLALTMRTLGAPIGVLGKSILDVFKKHAGDEYRLTGACHKIYMNTFYYLSFSSFVFAVFLFFFSEILFTTLFGMPWIEAGQIAVLLIPLFALRFIASPLSYLIYIADKQHIALVWQATLLVMTLIVFYSNLSFVDMVLFYSLGYAGLYLIYIRLTYLMSLPKNQSEL
jgi:O-antigen/teichoic acid export membrane protein